MMKFKNVITIDGRNIGHGWPCYIIAEGGVNHFGDIEKAFSLVDAAVNSGADAFKTQHFKTEQLVSKIAPEWRMRLKPKELSDDDILRIRDHCQKRGITFLCTAHDEIALELMAVADVPAFKVGSGEVENWPFIEKIARYGRPVILSVGMYTEQQVREVVEIFEKAKNPDLAILHCHTGYPSRPQDVNLSAMKRIQDFFPGPVGYSDHTIGSGVPLAAVALGADILEKHITIDKNVPNAHDWKVSCDPASLMQLVSDIRNIELAIGSKVKEVSEDEVDSKKWARKSLVAKRRIEAGAKINRDDLIAKRPGTGISPAAIAEVVDRFTNNTIHQDELIKWENLS